MDSVSIEDLRIYHNLKLLHKFKCSELEKYNGTRCFMPVSSFNGISKVQYNHDIKILIHCFPKSLSAPALTWFNQLEMAKNLVLGGFDKLLY